MMPWARESFPRISAGIVTKAMARNISGRSITKDALCPRKSFSTGTENGRIVTDMPQTNTMLNKLAPTMFPSDRAAWPLARETMAVTSSGSEVPSATNVRAMTESGTPMRVASLVPLSTRRRAPMAIRAAPRIKNNIWRQSGHGLMAGGSSMSGF